MHRGDPHSPRSVGSACSQELLFTETILLIVEMLLGSSQLNMCIVIISLHSDALVGYMKIKTHLSKLSMGAGTTVAETKSKSLRLPSHSIVVQY